MLPAHFGFVGQLFVQKPRSLSQSVGRISTINLNVSFSKKIMCSEKVMPGALLTRIVATTMDARTASATLIVANGILRFMVLDAA
jgi:hypothetical protein